ncbi:GntR family transcriptional regulator [Mitsuokella jalaludinii]|uniref:GntR family transcriptional regulator n=1 Tax=Mitsuokella jalaludinii TaxID=187979 RepID=UPI002674D294|nr:GntR family transcriptional regulator [uncultured Mitsuokella sp.]
MVKYQEIANELRNQIQEGVYKAGEQLALEREMCEQYGVSRITIKKAVDQLVKDGLVVKRRGSGTFVKSLASEDVHDISMANQFSGFSKVFEGHEIATKVVRFDIIHPTAEVAEKLNITTDDFVYDIVRLRQVDGDPVVIEYTNMPIELIPGIKREVLEHSIYRYIEEQLHFKIQSAHRFIRALLPTPEEEELLHIDHGTMPILEVEQIAFLDDGRAFEYSKAHHRGDKQVFRVVSIR